MGKSFGDRLQEIIKDKMLTGSRFAKEIGISPQLLNAYLRDERSPSLKVINLIAVRFPEINTRWLLTGEETMLIQQQPIILHDFEFNSSKDSDIVSRLLGVIEKQQETIEVLSKSIREFDKIVEKMKNKLNITEK